MIRFSDISGANYGTVQFAVHGDGTGTVVKVNLTKAPFNVNFSGIVPSQVNIEPIDPDDANLTGTASVDVDSVSGDSILTVTYSGPLPTESQTCTATFLYNSL